MILTKASNVASPANQDLDDRAEVSGSANLNGPAGCGSHVSVQLAGDQP